MRTIYLLSAVTGAVFCYICRRVIRSYVSAQDIFIASQLSHTNLIFNNIFHYEEMSFRPVCMGRMLHPIFGEHSINQNWDAMDITVAILYQLT